MKSLQVILIFAILGYCFTDDTDKCTTGFEALKNRCENINSCKFYDYSPFCISTNNDDCSRGNGDEETCLKIFPKTFPAQRCVYNSGACQAADNTCADFYRIVNGVSFDKQKQRDICSQLKAGNGKKCLISDEDSEANGYTNIGCREFAIACDALLDVGLTCGQNLLNYTTKCALGEDGTTCSSTQRKCDAGLQNVNKQECNGLTSTSTNKKCVYNDGVCSAVYTSCNVYPLSSCEGQTPLVENGNDYDYKHICKYHAASTTGATPTPASCSSELRTCSQYSGTDASICEGLQATDTNKRCVYDTSGSRCREEYKSCETYSNSELDKTRGDCENLIMTEKNSKCLYNIEEDKCVTIFNYTTCEEYDGKSQKICELIKPSTHSRCFLDKDLKCKERSFLCSEVFDSENCLYYAKASVSYKRCAFDSSRDVCYEEYLRCEDYTGNDSDECENIQLYGKECKYELNRCRSTNKTCSDAYTEEECKLIAESGVSNPDRKVCRWLKEYNMSTGSATSPDKFICMETYKYCSDYRGGNQYFCNNYIKPFNEEGNKLDISYKCDFEDSRCEKVPKECSEANSNPVLCALISPNIKDHNVKYCAYIDSLCSKQYKTCESYEGTVTSDCQSIIPENYLDKPCGIKNVNGKDKCVTKDVCNIFENGSSGLTQTDNLCHSINYDCEYSSSEGCVTKIKDCENIKFYKDSEENEEICKNAETSEPYKTCSLKEDRSGCEEFINLEYSPSGTAPNTSQDSASGFISKGINLIIVLICLLF